jgi:hypothetical protein
VPSLRVMTKREGDTMREDYSEHKYDDPFTGFVYEQVILNGFEDESTTFGEGESATRVGRRIVTEDSQGFVGMDTYATEDEAKEALSTMMEAWEDEQRPYLDEYCREAGCRPAVHEGMATVIGVPPEVIGRLCWDCDESAHVLSCERSWINTLSGPERFTGIRR